MIDHLLVLFQVPDVLPELPAADVRAGAALGGGGGAAGRGILLRRPRPRAPPPRALGAAAGREKTFTCDACIGLGTD